MNIDKNNRSEPLTLEVIATGLGYSDLEIALEEILKHIKAGFASGFNGNDERDYRFTICKQ